MEQFNPKIGQIPNDKSKGNNPADQIKLFFMSMSDKDKLAYGLITLGVIFLIIGLILW